VAKSEHLISLAQRIADETPGFFERKGPGKGDRAANSFMARLREQALKALGGDFSEKKIVENTNLAVDFFFPDEGTIVEVALRLGNPKSEFERDVLKTLLAKEKDGNVKHLIFVSKPGGRKRYEQPSSQAIMSWAKRNHGIEISIEELSNNRRHSRSAA